MRRCAGTRWTWRPCCTLQVWPGTVCVTCWLKYIRASSAPSGVRTAWWQQMDQSVSLQISLKEGLYLSDSPASSVASLLHAATLLSCQLQRGVDLPSALQHACGEAYSLCQRTTASQKVAPPPWGLLSITVPFSHYVPDKEQCTQCEAHISLQAFITSSLFLQLSLVLKEQFSPKSQMHIFSSDQ